jgi:hypothetical protein
MAPQITEQREFTILQLLTEVGLILMKIEEQSRTDMALPNEPIKLLSEVLSRSRTKKEFQTNLKLALETEQFNVDALIDYISILSTIHATSIPIDKFSGTRFSQ